MTGLGRHLRKHAGSAQAQAEKSTALTKATCDATRLHYCRRCGFTPQYKGLAELHDKYKGKGFEVSLKHAILLLLPFCAGLKVNQYAVGKAAKADGVCAMFRRSWPSPVSGSFSLHHSTFAC